MIEKLLSLEYSQDITNKSSLTDYSLALTSGRADIISLFQEGGIVSKKTPTKISRSASSSKIKRSISSRYVR